MKKRKKLIQNKRKLINHKIKEEQINNQKKNKKIKISKKKFHMRKIILTMMTLIK